MTYFKRSGQLVKPTRGSRGNLNDIITLSIFFEISLVETVPKCKECLEARICE